jgi:hypothetical protein
MKGLITKEEARYAILEYISNDVYNTATASYVKGLVDAIFVIDENIDGKLIADCNHCVYRDFCRPQLVDENGHTLILFKSVGCYIGREGFPLSAEEVKKDVKERFKDESE